MAKKFNTNYTQQIEKQEEKTPNSLYNSSQVTAAEVTLDTINNNFDKIDKSTTKESDTFKDIFNDVNTIEELKLEEEDYINILLKLVNSYNKAINDDSVNKLYKRWAAPSYEFRDGIESNHKNYSWFFENKIKEHPFGITSITDDELFFSYNANCQDGNVTDDSINAYGYAGKKLIVLGFPTYYPEQTYNNEQRNSGKMYWPWYHESAILTKTESKKRKYPAYNISDKIETGELLRINLKIKQENQQIPEINLKLFKSDSKLTSDKFTIKEDINRHFKDEYNLKEKEKIQLPGWDTATFNSYNKDRKTVVMNHWLVAMDSLKHIVDIFKYNDSFEGNHVDEETVKDPLGFLFMNKNKLSKSEENDKQYSILIPGLELGNLDVNKRNILTGLLVELYKGISSENITENNFTNCFDNTKNLIDWLVNNKSLDNDIMNYILDNHIKSKMQVLKATYVSEKKTKELRKQLDKYITLSMESWYINQNISGILKKCSEESNIAPHELERSGSDKAILPWRNKYYTPQYTEVVEFALDNLGDDIEEEEFYKFRQEYLDGKFDSRITSIQKKIRGKIGRKQVTQIKTSAAKITRGLGSVFRSKKAAEAKKAKAAAEAKAKAEAEAKAKADAEAKAKAKAEARARAQAEAKAKAEEKFTTYEKCMKCAEQNCTSYLKHNSSAADKRNIDQLADLIYSGMSILMSKYGMPRVCSYDLTIFQEPIFNAGPKSKIINYFMQIMKAINGNCEEKINPELKEDIVKLNKKINTFCQVHHPQVRAVGITGIPTVDAQSKAAAEASPGTTPVVQDGGKRRNNSKRLSSQSGGKRCSGSIRGLEVVNSSDTDINERDILDKLYVEKVKGFLPSLPEPIAKKEIYEFVATEHNSSMNQILGLINRWINDDDYEEKTRQFINHCQLNYQESKLFAIKNYPEQISKRNDWITFSIIKKLQKQHGDSVSPSKLIEIINSWSKQKIDTIVGVLMNPYFKIIEVKPTGYCDVKRQIKDSIKDKDDLEELNNILNNTNETEKTIDIGVTNNMLSDQISPNDIEDGCSDKREDSSSSEIVPITDFKMFYVLQNNNTQLKCYDQLKVLANFAGFIKKISSK